MTRDSRIYCQQGPDSLAATNQGALSGMDFVFKDLFDVKGYVTGAGNPRWLETHAPAKTTSPIIEALLAQGANCIGRVQTDELAYSLNGQNIHYGTPINPVAEDSIPGGSSSGSAVAVARGDCDFAIGTDTGGSVRVPASYCGLLGLRPTHGKLDLSHCFELAKTFDTAGIFSADIQVMRTLWQALTGADSGNKVNAIYLDNRYRELLSDQRYQRFSQACEQAGIELLSGSLLDELKLDFDQLSLLFRTIQGYEIIQKHGDWLAQYGDSLDPSILERVHWAKTISAQEHQQASETRAKLTADVLALLSSMNCLWALPTTPSAPPKLTMAGEPLAQYRSQLMGLTSLSGLCGLPQLHLPLPNLSEGPCGISLLGLADTEADLISTAEALLAALNQKSAEV
ncbi:amidase [Reinekea thalattae]|uniref:Amidase n=1 Tax=Reinekea thalattae TaxID=2593301 RepID=A0A5C8Z3W3_9GAMM|nr:amidase [Reinekea thalattae]TXR51949.1 amidase [Reinekea thalattae]